MKYLPSDYMSVASSRYEIKKFIYIFYMPMFQFELKGRKKLKVGDSQARGIPLFGRGQPFLLVRLSTDWMRPTHIRKTICFTQSIDLNIILIPQKTFTEHPA